jgi:hypothetical protein
MAKNFFKYQKPYNIIYHGINGINAIEIIAKLNKIYKNSFKVKIDSNLELNILYKIYKTSRFIKKPFFK